MNKIIVTIVILTQMLYPQPQHQIDSLKRKIQDIQLDQRYMFGESSHEEMTIAHENAIKDFLISANILRTERGLTLINHETIRDRINSLSYIRGERYYIFLYMTCSDILSITDISTHNGTPSVSQDVELSQLNGLSNDGFTREILQNIIDREMIENVWGYLVEQKKTGHVSDFDKARGFNEIPGNAYLVIFDRQFRVAAILSPVNNDARINIRNNMLESVSQYKGHGVVWFKL